LCAVVAGSRSYTAIAEWVADLPEQTAGLLGIDARRRPSEAMIRRLLQALDHDRLSMAIGSWLAADVPAPAPGSRRAIAVDGKTPRGFPHRQHQCSAPAGRLRAAHRRGAGQH
jgi:DDE_Tnp_1-associated